MDFIGLLMTIQLLILELNGLYKASYDLLAVNSLFEWSLEFLSTIKPVY
jgi:hypothetical protein